MRGALKLRGAPRRQGPKRRVSMRLIDAWLAERTGEEAVWQARGRRPLAAVAHESPWRGAEPRATEPKRSRKGAAMVAKLASERRTTVGDAETSEVAVEGRSSSVPDPSTRRAGAPGRRDSGSRLQNPRSGSSEACDFGRRMSAEQSARVVKTAEAQWTGDGCPEGRPLRNRVSSASPTTLRTSVNTLKGTMLHERRSASVLSSGEGDGDSETPTTGLKGLKTRMGRIPTRR